jgi:hypothetical protein
MKKKSKMYVYLAIIVTGVSCLSYGTKPCPDNKGTPAVLYLNASCFPEDHFAGYSLFIGIDKKFTDGSCIPVQKKEGVECTKVLKHYIQTKSWYKDHLCKERASAKQVLTPKVYWDVNITACEDETPGD